MLHETTHPLPLALKGAASWLEKLNQSISKFSALAEEKRVSRFRNELQDSVQQLVPSLSQLCQQFDASHFEDKRLPI